jgi:hypothetical protein
METYDGPACRLISTPTMQGMDEGVQMYATCYGVGYCFCNYVTEGEVGGGGNFARRSGMRVDSLYSGPSLAMY